MVLQSSAERGLGDERDRKSMKSVRWKDEGLDNVPRAL